MSPFTYDHIHIRSTDPEEPAAYYARMFDAQIIRTMQEGKPRIDMKFGGQELFIAPVASTSSAKGKTFGLAARRGSATER
jgi:hypothetical protein